MSDERLRVTKSSRSRLNELKQPDETTYSDVLARILPEDDAEILRSEEMVSISVSPEIHDRVFDLADENVSAYRVVEYYLYRHEVERVVAADDLLDALYNRGNEAKNNSEQINND